MPKSPKRKQAYGCRKEAKSKAKKGYDSERILGIPGIDIDDELMRDAHEILATLLEYADENDEVVVEGVRLKLKRDMIRKNFSKFENKV